MTQYDVIYYIIFDTIWCHIYITRADTLSPCFSICEGSKSKQQPPRHPTSSTCYWHIGKGCSEASLNVSKWECLQHAVYQQLSCLLPQRSWSLPHQRHCAGVWEEFRQKQRLYFCERAGLLPLLNIYVTLNWNLCTAVYLSWARLCFIIIL